MNDRCITAIETTTCSQEGWKSLYNDIGPNYVEHVKWCRTCQERLAELVDEEPLEFMTWGLPASGGTEGRAVLARMIRRGKKELQMQIEICAWVWKRDGHIGKVRVDHGTCDPTAPPATVHQFRR